MAGNAPVVYIKRKRSSSGVYCIAPGCTNGFYTKKEEVHFHRLPLTDEKLLKAWVISMKRSDPPLNHYARVCSEHFKNDDYVHKMRFDESGCLVQYKTSDLKPGSVPTIFDFSTYAVGNTDRPSTSAEQDNDSVNKREVRATKRVASAAEREVKRAVHTAAGLLSCQTEDTSCIGADDASDDSQVLEAHTTKRGQSVTVATQTEPLEPCPCKTVTLVSVQTGTDDINNSQLLSHDHPYCVSRDIAGGSATLAPADAMAKAPPSPTPDVSMPEEDASSSGESIPGTESSSSDYSPTEDDIIQNDSEDDGEHSVDGGEDPVSDKKYLVSHAQPMKLFCVCGKCVISRPYCSAKGFGLTVKTDCIDGHEFVWTSQPLLNGTMSCNLLVPAVIFLTGNAYGPFSEICQCLGLESLSTRHCCNIQRVYVLPEVTSVWNLHNEAVMAATGDQVVTVSGDGRCDSPGHCVTFGTYTMLDIKPDHNVTISILVTDFHPAVQKMLRDKTIKHEFDLWHIVKGVKKRMLQSRNTELKEWVRMYVPKRKKFTEESFQARLRLAALDHNHNIDREQAQTKKGALQFKLQYSTPAGGYVVKAMKTPKSYNFRRDIMVGVVERCLSASSMRSELAEHRHTDAEKEKRTLGAHKGLVKPSKEDAVAHHLSRFVNK
ncbi:uncharacterized protein LOC117554485 [Gymnodraco acuticeps]|uniref:Uncharacterized protein LOC117554485 n=1 Tax=Gymnodraco acuticeps TaxID=8218 RepID=A0A6P8VFE7_GYMAC|nr:uncharacterized protein LOC117554485 [Gymnodraco acuticeps]